VTSSKPRVGISSCLLGENVRYDGTNKASVFHAEDLSDVFEWVPVCPEVEIGLGVPREPIELVRDGDQIRLRGVTSRTDHTEAMRTFAARRIERLATLGLHGYVLKARSPSCGPSGVPVAGTNDTEAGVFAAALVIQVPGLPLVHEENLVDLEVRRRFLKAVRDRAIASET
jgi:uncharacterized protein YbbK (DUF523 family)